MTDKELIETLRGRNGFGWTEDAADRIEALVADVAGWISNAQAASGWASEAEYKLEVAEKIGRAFEEDAGQLRAKLAKAVEALREVEESSATYQERAKARAVLEELEKPE
jgi:ribosome-binding protein aMBF1 (putative translation factor)